MNISIFQYTDYRLFLKDFFEQKKATEGYTYRDFAGEVGSNSSSWLLHLIKGTKNLTTESAFRIAKAMKWSEDEAEYFVKMVSFTQAKKSDVKNLYFRDMVQIRKRLNITEISEEQYEYYTKWYHPVIRSLVSKISWNDDYSVLAGYVLPSITPSEAHKSVNLLKRLGFIEKDGNGQWKQKDLVISTGDEVQSLNVINYHKQMCEIARDAFDRCDRSKRDISALTMGVNEKVFTQIKSRIQDFRKELMDIVEKSENSDRVYQLNLHFFPLSKEKL